MIEPTIERILVRVGAGKTTWSDETKLRQYVNGLLNQLADAQDAARRAVVRVPVIDLDDLPHTCGECGSALEHVRPGGWQCNACEAERVAQERA